jgi:hypothetical protein
MFECCQLSSNALIGVDKWLVRRRGFGVMNISTGITEAMEGGRAW